MSVRLVNRAVWSIKGELTLLKPWWRHQMETFSALLALCAGNSPVTGESPHKDQWRGAVMFSLICAWINDWVNNREAGDLRRHCAHYDVIVMIKNMTKREQCTWFGGFTMYPNCLNNWLALYNATIHDAVQWHIYATPGGRLNKKDGLTRYGDSHVKDKTS